MKRKRKLNGARSLIFETPPHILKRMKKEARQTQERRSGVWLRALEPLKNFPGRWVKVRRMGSKASAYMTATMLRNGQAIMPKGRYEYATNGPWLYARYLG